MEAFPINQKKETNSMLNLLKGCACISVLLIHVPFPAMFGRIVQAISAYAVPIFFLTAGYYAFGAASADIKRRLFKMIRIFLYAYTLFFLYYAAQALYRHELFSWLHSCFNLRTLRQYLCFCTIDFAIPLWYLLAMIETYVFWLLIVKCNGEEKTLKWIPLLFVLQVLLTAYCETRGLAWFWKTNFITRALPWFLSGYYLHTDHAEKIKNTSMPKLVAAAIAGCFIAAAPTAFDLPLKFSVIGYIPLALSLFAIALKNPAKNLCTPLTYLGDKLSLHIYIYHVLANDVIGLLRRKVFRIETDSRLWQWCRPIIVLLVTVLLSLMIVFIGQYLRQHTARRSAPDA